MDVSPDAEWQQQIERLKLLFPELTNEDFKFDYGMKEVTLMKLQTLLGKSREELNACLDGHG